MLINVPRMRETLEFVMKHNSSASLGLELTSTITETRSTCCCRVSISNKEPFFVRFSGPKPHYYLSFLSENSCYEPFQSGAARKVCYWIQIFAKYNKIVHPVAYCQMPNLVQRSDVKDALPPSYECSRCA